VLTDDWEAVLGCTCSKALQHKSDLPEYSSASGHWAPHCTVLHIILERREEELVSADWHQLEKKSLSLKIFHSLSLSLMIRVHGIQNRKLNL